MQPSLQAAAAAPVLLIGCDYDGTLAPIVNDPAAAHPDRRAVAALQDLASLPDTFVTIISGRARVELRRLVGPISGVALVGGHGSEWDDAEISLSSAALATRLREVAARFPGAHVESKPSGAAFHYRRVDRLLVDSAARSAISAGTPLAVRVVHGKRVVEFSTSDADKGSALRRLRQQTSPSVTVFIGDDVTDEDAFSVLGPSDLAVAVGGHDSKARWRLDSQRDVAPFLEQLAAQRSARQRGS